MKAPVNETLAVAFIAVCMLIGLEKAHDTELSEVHKDGVAVGYKLGQIDLTETMAKRVTSEKCMLFWFSDNSMRVGEAIKKVKLQ